MTAPKQGRKPGTPSRPGGPGGKTAGGKSRDRGTRGGRPDASPASARRRAGEAGRTGATDRAGTSRNGAGDGGPAANGVGRATGRTTARTDRKPSPTRAAPEAAAPAGLAVPSWLQWTTLLLSLGGLGVSIYLTIVHYTTALSIACPENSTVNCEKVITSPQSYVFGIPVAVLGLAFFVLMVALTTPWAWRGTGPFAWLVSVTGWTRLGSAIVGIIFVLYLVYTEVITLNMTICLWCTAVHVITLLLFGLLVYAATAGYGLTRSR
ncbi:MAG TPA: vitamin K epoxide reductase family protein [Streptosporangiaceae bacterium]